MAKAPRQSVSATPHAAAPVPPRYEPEAGEQSARQKPVFEVRMGRIKAVVWANETEGGVRHNVVLRRIFKRDGSHVWEQSDSFGRDDLPLVIEVTRRAWTWIFENGQNA